METLVRSFPLMMVAGITVLGVLVTYNTLIPANAADPLGFVQIGQETFHAVAPWLARAALVWSAALCGVYVYRRLF